MDRRKEKRWKAALSFVPVCLFLACGTAKEGIELTKLADLQTKTEDREGNTAEETASEAAGQTGGFLTEQEHKAGETETKEALTVFVHICGEVVLPGVYEVSQDGRVCDVLLLAGGFTEEAATDAVNLAERVSDGMQVVIPSAAQAAESRQQAILEKAGLVNINTASVEELCSLPGIGESRAGAIIEYREKEGGFRAAEEIMQVTGIKEGMYEKLAEMICVE